jgi:hypothetical protein
MNADDACARSREKRLDCLGRAYMTGVGLKVNEGVAQSSHAPHVAPPQSLAVIALPGATVDR